MKRWFDRLRFFWEEEVALPEEVPRGAGEESVGVPRPLRTATRFAVIGTVATSLMGQIIGIRLVAPVDAAPAYRAQCVQACNDQFKADQAACASQPPGQRGKCLAAAAQKKQSCQNSCNAP